MHIRTLTLAVAVVACATRSAGSQQCAIGNGASDIRNADPRRLAGVFDLEWRPAAGPWTRTARRQRLWLWPTSPSDSALENHRHPAPGDTALYPLFGTVTAQSVSPSKADSLRATVDPIYATVFLRALGDRSRDYFELAVLVGTVEDRDPTMTVLDGAGESITVARIGQRGFAGSYVPWGIAMIDTGFACAVRVR